MSISFPTEGFKLFSNHRRTLKYVVHVSLNQTPLSHCVVLAYSFHLFRFHGKYIMLHTFPNGTEYRILFQRKLKFHQTAKFAKPSFSFGQTWRLSHVEARSVDLFRRPTAGKYSTTHSDIFLILVKFYQTCIKEGRLQCWLHCTMRD